MASAKEKRIVKGILHDIAHNKDFEISRNLPLKLKKTNVEIVNITITLEAKFKEDGIRKRDKIKYESKSMNSLMK